MRRFYLLLLFAVFTIGLLGACGTESSGSGGEKSEPKAKTETKENKTDNKDTAERSGTAINGKVITILTGGTSGVYFPLGNALAKVYNEEGAQASAQTSGASAVNSAKVAQKKAELSLVMADTVSDAYNGAGKFEQTGALDNLRGISALYTNYMQIVAIKGSGVTSIEDLKGKKVAVGAPGSGTEIMAKRVLNAAGLTYDDINEDFLSFKEGVEGIKNGVIDVAILVSGIPNAGIMELATTEDIEIVNIPENIVTDLKEFYPAFISSTVPAGTYEGVDKVVQTAAVKNLLITHADVTDEEAYELTKQLHEQIQVLRDTHTAAKGIILEEATTGLPLPLHPGAEKYYREKGVLK